MNAQGARTHPLLRSLVEALAEALGPRLRSVVLYGSAARGDYHAKSSDLNLILVVDPADTAALEAIGPPVRRFVRKGHPIPRLFTPGLIARSADSFPIEFLDIGGGRIVLHGEDPFAAVTIDREALRLQLERELKEKIMLLREAYVMVHGSPAGLRRLLTESYPAFAALFRGGLHLLGRPIPSRSAEVVTAFCAAAGLDRSPFDEIARLRRGEKSGAAPKAIFARYHDALERAADAVDRLISRGGEAR